MIIIDLIPVPNQSLTVTTDNVLWELTIKVADSMMVADVVRDGEILVQGSRIVEEGLLLPYRYLSLQGNFSILTPPGEIPWWEQFGDTHQMVYLSWDELK